MWKFGDPVFANKWAIGPTKTLALNRSHVRHDRFTASGKHVRAMNIFNKGVCREIHVGLPIFSSPEPLGSQGELIGWP